MAARRRPPAPFVDDSTVEQLAPFVDWATFVSRLDYRHDEHVTIVGPTGRGKTTLGLAILNRRRNVIVIGTKPNDSTLDELLADRRYVRVAGSTLPAPTVARRLVVWPTMRGVDDVVEQRRVIGAVMDQSFREGNRALFADEVHYLAEFLHLSPRLKLWWTQGRSNGLSLVAGFQRPAWVPRDAYSSATHLFLFGTADETDAKALGGIGGMNNRIIREVVQWLAADPGRRHEFLYLNTRTGNMVRSRLRK